ncbi:MAG: DNA-processing protein DprA [Lachnospiraceae bacterium]|nr:DNA-processing protein DprA [Lachnospiraceae bacterium]
MNERIYDYWAATLQNGYIGNLIDIVQRAGGARVLYEMSEEKMLSELGLGKKLAAHFTAGKEDINILEKQYHEMYAKGIYYVNHTDTDFPDKLKDIPASPYGLFVKGALPDSLTPSVAVVGARECSEYGRLMAQYFADRLARKEVQIISGMAWGIDGIAQEAAIDAGGRSFAVLGCGVDTPYPSKNRQLYNRLCVDGNGVISEYAPGTPAIAKNFPPRNRIISGLCDVLIVVEARAKSGTLITVDMATDQGKCVMIVPGRLTDNLSVGCLNLLYQGALPATSIESVLEQLGPGKSVRVKPDGKTAKRTKAYGWDLTPITKPVRDIPEETKKVAGLLTIEPQSIEAIAHRADMSADTVMIMLTKLEMEGIARETWPGYFIREPELA